MKYSKRMTGMLLVICLCLLTGNVRSQSVAQLIEQLTLDIQKLSELKTILKDMREGYQVLDKGYINIRDIVKGNFNLHKTFLDGLLSVSLPVRQYYKVSAILDKEKSVIKECQTERLRWISGGLFTSGELRYIQQWYEGLSGRVGKCLDRLTMVLTPDELRMSDAERMAVIDRIDLDMERQLEGLRWFSEELTIQALQRGRELNNIQKLQNIYGNYP